MNEAVKDKNVRRTPICLPPKMIAALDEAAQAEGLFRGRSLLVRRAVNQYLARSAQRPRSRAAHTEKATA